MSALGDVCVAQTLPRSREAFAHDVWSQLDDGSDLTRAESMDCLEQETGGINWTEHAEGGAQRIGFHNAGRNVGARPRHIVQLDAVERLPHNMAPLAQDERSLAIGDGEEPATDPLVVARIAERSLIVGSDAPGGHKGFLDDVMSQLVLADHASRERVKCGLIALQQPRKPRRQRGVRRG